MFEKEDLERLSNAGYSVSASGEVTDSFGSIIPVEVYSQELAFNNTYTEEELVPIEQDFTQTDSYKSILRQEKELAKKQVNRFLEDPGSVAINFKSPYIQQELRERGEMKYIPKAFLIESKKEIKKVKEKNKSITIQKENVKNQEKKSNQINILDYWGLLFFIPFVYVVYKIILSKNK